MSWCRSLGSSGDSQVRILGRSSAIARLILVVLKELSLLLNDSDIFCSLLFRVSLMIDDGVSRLRELPRAEEVRGFL